MEELRAPFVQRRAAGVLLTGGSSRRMGFDKTTVAVGGVPCAVRAAGLLVAVLSPVVEIGPGRTALPAVAEEPPGSGPLMALVAARGWLGDHDAGALPAIVVAGDLPFVTVGVLSMLRDWPGESSVVPVVNGRPQPLLARWSPGALSAAERAARRGDRSLRPLLAHDDVERVDERRFPDGIRADDFADVDSPADLARFGLDR